MKVYLIAAMLAGTAGVATAQAPVQRVQVAPQAVTMAPMRQIDRVQTRDEVVAKVRERFARADANRDGFVAADEMRGQRGERRARRMAMRGGQQRANPGAAFERLDTNRDNMLSREEFAAGRSVRAERRGRLGAMRGQGMAQRMGMRGQGGMLRRADADRDGRVSLAEAQAAALQRFDRVDVNRDGRITPDERQQMRQQRMQRRAPRVG